MEVVTHGRKIICQLSCSLFLQMFLVEGARYEAMPQGSDDFSTCEVAAGQTPLLAAGGAPGGARIVLPFPNGSACLPLRWAVCAANAIAESLQFALLPCAGQVGCLPVPHGVACWGGPLRGVQGDFASTAGPSGKLCCLAMSLPAPCSGDVIGAMQASIGTCGAHFCCMSGRLAPWMPCHPKVSGLLTHAALLQH